MALWDTAGNIINDAATELGLQSFQAKSADPFASTDPNLGQLCQLLKSVGRDLAKKREWTHLRSVARFITTGAPRQDLPVDFSRMVNQTGWNQTTRLPLGGPLSPQEWQYLDGQMVGVVFTVLFRPMQGQLWLYPANTSSLPSALIAYEYVSRWWCQPVAMAPTRGLWQPDTAYDAGDTISNFGRLYEANSTGTSAAKAGGVGPSSTGSVIPDGLNTTWKYLSDAGNDAPSALGDTILFDPQLVLRALKLAFLRAKGFDTLAAEEDYDDAYAQACAEDTPARVLNLSRGGILRQPLIGASNIPITGIGS